MSAARRDARMIVVRGHSGPRPGRKAPFYIPASTNSPADESNGRAFTLPLHVRCGVERDALEQSEIRPSSMAEGRPDQTTRAKRSEIYGKAQGK